jgi:peroxiredoxin
MALTHTPAPELGAHCPDFTLKAVDGRIYGRADFADSEAFLVMFICVHCPYVVAVEDRLLALAREYLGKPLKIVAICANDGVRYPADSFASMKAHATNKGYPFPYLHDETQNVARAFGAVCTPDFLLYDSKFRLAYRGRLDDSWKEAAKVQTQELKAAVDALLKGELPSSEQKPSMGCSIKWKEHLKP